MSTGADWVEQARKLVDTFLAPDPAAGDGRAPEGCPDPAAHGAACRWCPVCQVVAVARGERPDVSAALADVLTATATALRTFAADASSAASPEPAANAAPAAGATPAAGAAPAGDADVDAAAEPVAQRIEIA